MSSIAKVIAGAKRIVVGAAVGDGRKGGRAGDAFKALLDKAGATTDVRETRHAGPRRVHPPTPVAALGDELTTGPLPYQSERERTDRVDHGDRPIRAAKGDDAQTEGAPATPLVVLTPIVSRPETLLAETTGEAWARAAAGEAPTIDRPPATRVPPDIATATRADRAARLQSQTVKVDAIDTLAHPENRSAAPFASPLLQTAPAVDRSPAGGSAPARQSSPTGIVPEADNGVAIRALPQIAVLQYRSHLRSAPPRSAPQPSAEDRRHDLSVDSDPAGQPEPAREPVRAPYPAASHFEAKSNAGPQPQLRPAIDPAAYPGEPAGAPVGLPAPLLEALGDFVTTATLGFASEPPPEVDPTSEGLDTATPARHVEVAVDLQDYGIVNLRVTLSGQALTLRMSADRADTAHRLHREREALGVVLAKVGFDADILPVDRASPSAPAAGSPDSFAQLGGGASFSDPGSRRADPNRPQPRGTSFEEQSDGDETRAAGARRAGALYV